MPEIALLANAQKITTLPAVIVLGMVVKTTVVAAIMIESYVKSP